MPRPSTRCFARSATQSRRTFGLNRPFCGRVPSLATAPAGDTLCVPRKVLWRRGRTSLTLQRTQSGPGASPRRFPPMRCSGFSQITLGLRSGASGCASLWRRQLHSRSTRFREPNRNRLLRRLRAMFSLSNVVDLFTHKFACLCARRFSLFFVSPRPFNDFFFRHFSPPQTTDTVSVSSGRSEIPHFR